MNERIKELKREAEALAYEEHKANCIKNGRDTSMPHANALNMTFEKFAELLIRECLSKVNEAVYAREMSGRYYPDSDGKKILKHFGVEE